MTIWGSICERVRELLAEYHEHEYLYMLVLANNLYYRFDIS